MNPFLSLCVQGFKYAAVQFSYQCFCGDDQYDRYGTAQNCNLPCIGDRGQMCGGGFANQVYRIGGKREGKGETEEREGEETGGEGGEGARKRVETEKGWEMERGRRDREGHLY